MKLINNPDRSQWAEILKRPVMNTENLFDTVREIIDRVKSDGDRAVLEMEAKFDKAELTSLAVTEAELKEAETLVDEKLKAASTSTWSVHRFEPRLEPFISRVCFPWGFISCPQTQSLSIMRFLLSVQLVLRDIVVESERLLKKRGTVGAQLFAVGVVGGDHLPRLVRQLRAAAVLAARRGGQKMEAQPVLGIADDRPRLGIGHGHRQRRRAQRMQLVYALQKLGHAGAKAFLVGKHTGGENNAELTIHRAALPFCCISLYPGECGSSIRQKLSGSMPLPLSSL